MFDRAFEYLVYLLRLGLGIPSDVREPISPEVWRLVYRLAAKHAVLGVAWDGVACLQSQSPQVLQSLPADLMGKWFADVQTIESANRRMTEQASQLQSFMQEGNFEAYVLKGRTWADYYPNPEHRQSADIDLWVLPEHTPDTPLSMRRQALLLFLKSREVPVKSVVYHHIEAQFFPDTEVELHVTPTWLCDPAHNRRLQKLFAQAGHLTPERQELYVLLHAFRHIYHDGLALRHVVDYYRIREANRQRGLNARWQIRQVGLSSFAAVMDELTDYLFAVQQKDAAQLSCRARHLLTILPSRQLSSRVQWDYPSETLWVFPWRTWHYFWRKRFAKECNS